MGSRKPGSAAFLQGYLLLLLLCQGCPLWLSVLPCRVVSACPAQTVQMTSVHSRQQQQQQGRVNHQNTQQTNN
jgi:hypothetical protein